MQPQEGRFDRGKGVSGGVDEGLAAFFMIEEDFEIFGVKFLFYNLLESELFGFGNWYIARNWEIIGG